MELESVGQHTRSYQQEMFERSMRGNTIVVMDTGSGKTHVAILRIQAELDRCPPEKRVWFLAPTVALCHQQHHELSTALPAYQHRLLTGEDNVERWSEQAIWDAALDKHRVVVSTHAVLADALGHGFVNLSSLALIVFDEAHHCDGNHPANKIMRDFYHVAKAADGQPSVPCILGLSASLIMRSDLRSISTLERNLDAIGVAPRIHRQDLMRYVHRPECQMLKFDPCQDLHGRTTCKSLRQLCNVHDKLDLLLKSREDSSTANVEMMRGTVTAFRRTAEAMLDDLGPWAADFFINQTIDVLQQAGSDFQALLEVQGATRRTLLDVFETHGIQSLCRDHIEPSDDTITSKVKCLISFLLESDVESLVGIVFVKRRATTSVLTALLQRHPLTKERLRCRPFVGTSNAPSRRFGLHELIDLKLQKETLGKFRAGEYNLIIATNALEEGIDVQSCNVVACFDSPPNVKSFIQRRGRARHVQSRLAILLSVLDDQTTIAKWEAIEQELSLLCQSDRRQAARAGADELPAESLHYELHAPSTGAKLTQEDTLAHLNHFCNKLPHRQYSVLLPEYSYDQDSASGLIKATVTLPNALSLNVRQATSSKAWKTERAAQKDAAFQAYAAIYRAGLLNDNLLPLSQDWNDGLDDGDDDNEQLQASRADIPPQIDIWTEMATSEQQRRWYKTPITLSPPRVLGETPETVLLLTPQPLIQMPQLSLQWTSEHIFSLEFGPSTPIGMLAGSTLELLQASTRMLYTSVRSERVSLEDTGFTTLFAPDYQHEHLQSWIQQNSRQMSVDDFNNTLTPSLVRVPWLRRPVLAFHGWAEEKETVMVQCEQAYKRKNFTVEAIQEVGTSDNAYSAVDKQKRLESFPASDCTFSTLPHCWARLGMFMPAILQHIEDSTITARLQSSLLQAVTFRQPDNVLTAVSAPSAIRRANYQRLEFFGDSVLKYVVSAHLYATQKDWHEGYLSVKRAQLVSNMRLARAASRLNLAQFIITEPLSYKTWTPPLLSPSSQARNSREISNKVLADVVEALIGAAWVDSGLEAAMQCISLFLPTLPLSLTNPLSNVALTSPPFQGIDDIQPFVGYTFQHPVILLEALTHPSCGGHTGTESYQRLEFLGDAVLDMLVAQRLSAAIPPLSQGRMTQLKAALVNARLLGFLCLDLRHAQTQRAVQTDTRTRSTSETTAAHDVCFAAFLRTAAPAEMRAAQLASQLRFAAHREPIRSALATGTAYPWTQLLALRPEKLYSDMVESVLGAIYVDSGGDLEACKPFLHQLGLLAYAERLVKEHGVDVTHPRERVQQVAGGRAVTYRVVREDASRTCGCELLVDEEVVAAAEGCWDKEEAVALAASRAEEVLKVALMSL